MPWRAVGASVPGMSHVNAGRGCDDAHGWFVRDDLVVLVVADGAGSRPGTSAIGAHIAVQSALQRAVDEPQSSLEDLFSHALEALAFEAARLGVGVERLATTLLVAVVSEDR